VSASDQLNKPLIGGPRSYYLSLFNDDTIFFDPSNYPPQGEAERVDAEQKHLLARVAPAPIEEESKDGGASPAKARRKKAAAPGATLPLVMQDSRLEEPRMLRRQDIVTIKELLNKGFGYQHGDRSIGEGEELSPSCSAIMCPELCLT
jgi:hypothetical protein